MKISLQLWWSTEIYKHKGKFKPEETIKEIGSIAICDIIIDGEVVGTVRWDGKECTLSKELVQPK